MNSIISTTRPSIHAPLFSTGFSLTRGINPIGSPEAIGAGLVAGVALSALSRIGLFFARYCQAPFAGSFNHISDELGFGRDHHIKQAFIIGNVVFLAAATGLGLFLYAKVASLGLRLLIVGLHSSFARAACSPLLRRIADETTGEEDEALRFEDNQSGIDRLPYAVIHLAALSLTVNPVLAAAAPAAVWLAEAFSSNAFSERFTHGTVPAPAQY